MDTNMRRDLNISGVLGGCGGGTFNQLSINGHGNIDGSVDCIGFVCSGKATVRGALKANNVEVNGIASFCDSIDAGKFRVNGKSDIEGPVNAREFRIDGHAKVNGSLNVEEVSINGNVAIKGNCDAERFHSRGSFRIDGLLNAGTIEIELFAECRAKEIGGESILVRKSDFASPFGKLMKALVFSKDLLIADMIEGDEIRLEYTKANIVRGTNVTIGAGCEIGLVEYKGEFKRTGNGIVAESRLF